MPLFDLSSNIQESEAASRKRSHDEFVQGTLGLDDTSAGFENFQSMLKSATESASGANASVQGLHVAPSILITNISPPSPSSSPDAMTEAGSSTPAHNSPSPNQTPSPSPNPPVSASSTSTQAVTMPTTTSAAGTSSTKRKRKTTPEREADEQEKKAKRAKADADEQERKAKKAKADAEKEARKEADELKKAEKEAKRRKKEEEEEKKKRQQPSLLAYLKPKQNPHSPSTPKKQTPSKAAEDSPAKSVTSVDVPSPSIEKPSQPEKTAYEKMFYDFFVKPDVTMAPPPFYMTSETKETKSRILDEYVRQERGQFNPKPFNPIETFQFNGVPIQRGIQRAPVKKLMADLMGDDNASSAQRTESQRVRVAGIQKQLNSIPVKILSYFEDVRPAYVGTITSTLTSDLQKLARRPTQRLLKVNYDYESEAEWEEEEGEDLGDDEDEDEENEADEEMADFLDDAEAEDAASRPTFLGDSEPTSTGICYEDRKRLSRNVNGDECATVYKYRMEFLLESLVHHHSIDPFSTEYWQPKVQPKTISKSTVPDPAACNQSKITSMAGMAPPPVPRAGPSGPAAANHKDMIDQGLMDDFKKAVVSSDINFLTRVGIVDMLSKRFPSATKAQVRTTLEFVADRYPVPGEKKSVKQWGLRPEHALAS